MTSRSATVCGLIHSFVRAMRGLGRYQAQLCLADLEGSPRYRFVRGDIANGELVADVFRTERIDGVMHLAAESHVDRSILAPAVFIETNVRAATAASAEPIIKVIDIT